MCLCCMCPATCALLDKKTHPNRLSSPLEIFGNHFSDVCARIRIFCVWQTQPRCSGKLLVQWRSEGSQPNYNGCIIRPTPPEMVFGGHLLLSVVKRMYFTWLHVFSLDHFPFSTTLPSPFRGKLSTYPCTQLWISDCNATSQWISFWNGPFFMIVLVLKVSFDSFY